MQKIAFFNSEKIKKYPKCPALLASLPWQTKLLDGWDQSPFRHVVALYLLPISKPYVERKADLPVKSVLDQAI